MNLIMLTKFYPFGTGEAFIENEMAVLSQYYKKILVIACEAPNTSNVRKVPANVTVCKVSEVKFIGRINDIIRGQLYHIKSGSEFISERKNCKTLMQKVFLGYFEGKCQRIYKKIMDDELLKSFIDEPFVLYSYWLFTTARIAIYIQRDYDVIYTFSRAHRYDLYMEKNETNYLPYREMFLNSFNKIFPCSLNGEHYLQEHYPKYKEKVKVSLLGTIDHGIGKSSTDDIFRIVSCSRIATVKRVERIPEALALLDNDGVKIEWTHIGGGSGLDEIKKNTVKHLKNINFRFLGDIPNAKVMEMYQKKPFDLFINVSSSEGLPVSIMEAISFGIPVIATDVGGTSEIVIKEETGILLKDEFENEDLANAIIKFYKAKKDNNYQNYRLKCRSYWEKHFQAMNNYNELHNYILSEVDKRGAIK